MGIPSKKPLGRLPMWLSPLEKESRGLNAPRIRSVNRYLAYQESRILNLKAQGKYSELIVRWCILLKNSKSYQVVLFNTVTKGWYWKLTEKETLQLLKSCMNKCRKWDMRLTLQRFYIDKGKVKTGVPNGKLRPIGAPTIQSRVISKSLNDLIYIVYEDQLKPFQHGYRRFKGTHTALIDVWTNIFVKKKDYIFEFDFISFFNSVEAKWVHKYMRSRSWDLADLILKIVCGIRYKFERSLKKLPKESELSFGGTAKLNVRNAKSKPFMRRKGLPQGLSFSPILATLVLEQFSIPDGLTMCADDGMIVTDKDNLFNVKLWFYELSKLGIKTEPTKTGGVKDGKFKFLGVEFNIDKETATFRESTISWKGWNLEEKESKQNMEKWFRTVTQFYGKEPERWNWSIKEGAYCERHYIEPYEFFKGIIWEKLSWIHFNSTFWNSFKGYRHFKNEDGKKGGILHISRTSTASCESLLTDLKDVELVRKRELKFTNEPKNKEPYFIENKTKYVEVNYAYMLDRENNPRYPSGSAKFG